MFILSSSVAPSLKKAKMINLSQNKMEAPQWLLNWTLSTEMTSYTYLKKIKHERPNYEIDLENN